ncbi:MAG: spermidine synthase [Betaproteobacteria bacterium]|nr:spermidine synthase [Betaproteobacteria bacterium]
MSEKQGVRYLHLAGPAVQSAMRIRAPWALELEYTRAMMAFLLFRPQAREIALIGLGGGSIAKFVHRFLPECRMTALEINPEVVAAARGFFLLPPDDERLEALTGDGAAYVHARPASRDVLMVDGYDEKRIVEDLASPAFYAAARAMLRPGGVAAFNLWGSDASFPVYFERIHAAFDDHVLRLPSERKGNIVVFAFNDPPPPVAHADLEQAAQVWSARLGLEFEEFLARIWRWNPVQEGRLLV